MASPVELQEAQSVEVLLVEQSWAVQRTPFSWLPTRRMEALLAQWPTGQCTVRSLLMAQCTPFARRAHETANQFESPLALSSTLPPQKTSDTRVHTANHWSHPTTALITSLLLWRTTQETFILSQPSVEQLVNLLLFSSTHQLCKSTSPQAPLLLATSWHQTCLHSHTHTYNTLTFFRTSCSL